MIVRSSTPELVPIRPHANHEAASPALEGPPTTRSRTPPRLPPPGGVLLSRTSYPAKRKFGFRLERHGGVVAGGGELHLFFTFQFPPPSRWMKLGTTRLSLTFGATPTTMAASSRLPHFHLGVHRAPRRAAEPGLEGCAGIGVASPRRGEPSTVSARGATNGARCTDSSGQLRDGSKFGSQRGGEMGQAGDQHGHEHFMQVWANALRVVRRSCTS